MKRYKKKELLHIINSLEKINNAVLRNFSLNVPVSVEVLAECQETAVIVGNVLDETFEAQGRNIVRILEDYCENLYQMSLVVNDNVRSRKLAKKIQKQLTDINNRVKYDLPDDRKEIVFLPYKASMWDSLESIWKAASRDETCDTYVIPIPYFDKNPDETLGKLHCEKREYPDYVPITDWQEYDISQHRPDVIYIHNPYDEFNYVTGVHPMFYTKELKKHTDMLVYIPYFVAIKERIQKHFCILPGTMYADRVVVQSETVRQTYIKEFQKFEKEGKLENLSVKTEEKFMALGSPKYDKILTTKRETYQIPEEWERLIVRPDGSRKKVILYNITVDRMLKQGERTLKKIKGVLKFFQRMSNVTLLWRPHPLLASTLASMRFQIAAEYDNIVDWYRKEDFGIFDDSADMYRAIAISDAYYGDMSSVVELYRKTGKPMLISALLPDENKGLMFEGYVQIDDFTAYASCAIFNGLFRIDISTGKCTYLGMFPGEQANGKRLHAKAVYTGGKIYFAPASAEYISVYEVYAGKFETISIHDYRGEYRFYKTALKFADAVSYGDYIFFISATYPAVIRMNCRTKVLDYYTDWVPDKGFVFRQGTLVRESVFYIPDSAGNAVLKFQMDKCSGQLLHIGVNNHGSWSICEAGNDYWLIPRNKGAFIRWNEDGNILAEYDDYPKSFEDRNFLFTKGYCCGGFLRVVPAYANMSVKVSVETGEITENKLVKVEDGEAVGFLFESAPYYYLFRQRKTEDSSVEYVAYYRLNILDNTLEEYSFEFCEGKAEFAADYYKYMIWQNAGKIICKEEMFFELNDFLRNLIEENIGADSLKDVICRQDVMSAGRRIHENIKELLNE